MEKNANTFERPFFVSAATVAGNLVSVMDIAKEISLAAKNANAIAERAGEKASGFRPITDYINEMGHETISLVDAINHKALEVSRIAVDELRAKEAYEKLVQAKEYSGEQAPASINKLIDEASESLNEQFQALENEIELAGKAFINLIYKQVGATNPSKINKVRSTDPIIPIFFNFEHSL